MLYTVFSNISRKPSRLIYKAKETMSICTDPKRLDRLINRFIGKEFGIVPDSFRLTLV